MTGFDSGRRKFLAATGTAMTIAVAGCSGGDDDNGDDGDDNGDDELDAPEEVQNWLDDENANEADSVEDLTGQDEVTIENGPDGDFVFDPAVTRVSEGTTVTWEWASGGHSVESEQTPGEAFDSGILDEGETFSETFDEAGNVLYFCNPHRAQGHVGAVIVE